MGILSWLVFGLLAGLVARALTPGRQAIGCLPTLAVGLVGALLGGVIGQVVLGHKVHFGWDLGPFVLAVVGAVVLLLALEALSGRRRGRLF
ncbi:MAG: GlsB/YeaQ/YmgE family stress response membrane protein [Gaiellaceae bacterium]